MDPKEDTKKTVPDQELQTGQPATERKSEPDQEQQKQGLAQLRPDLARSCKICGGPNHNGCGCEARAAKDIHTMAESCEDFKTIICDMSATLKVIAGDAITIRKFLTEEKTWLTEKEEVKNAVENQN